MKSKKLILGTALWGWAVSKSEAFLILDKFVEAGNYHIDCATNYPINGNIKDFGLALKWLLQWCNLNKNAISLLVKIGSINNLGTSFVDLSKDHILKTYDKLLSDFNDSLGCIAIHWDNRDNRISIKETISALNELKKQGIDIGLSGIKNPRIYYELMPILADSWIIQCKENLLTNEARIKYQKFFSNATYYAYGINIGGLKILYNDSISARIRKIKYPMKLKEAFFDALNTDNILSDIGFISINDINMSFIYTNLAYDGIIIGPRNLEQLNSTLKTFNTLKSLGLGDRDSLVKFLKELQDTIKA